jgi:asparagine synthase (glutamine-hydrolysing)
MCGINGLWNLAAPDTEKEVFDRFTDSLAHRGPDGRGVYQDERVRLWLGHRRLKILDLSEAGSQPMSYGNGRYWLTFNGEIYNFLELRSELEARGERFVSSSDSEVILAAYHVWKEECQHKFNGMWAFAIWDNEERRLFLSRDRFGVKPLYYFYDGRRFAFGSEMKAFLTLPFFSGDLDEQIVARSLADSNSIEAQEKCLFKELKRLKAGHSLHVTEKGDVKVHRWWSTLDHVKQETLSWDQKVERFFSLLTSACKLRMRSDVPLGSAVSGGLDSSSILALLGEIRREGANGERIHSDWHQAFVALFPGTSQDEHRFAKEIIESTKTPAVYCSIDASHMVDHLKDVLFSVEEIFDAPLGPWLLYREYRRRGIVISIDGHGADELLGGYSHHVEAASAGALFHPERYRDLRSIQENFYPPGSPYTPKSTKQLLLTELRRRLRKSPSVYALLKRLFSQNRLQQWLKVSWDSPESDLEGAHLDVLSEQLYIDFHHRTLPTILRNFDRCSMAHGVEIRSPFLDWRLVTFGFSLLSQDKIGGGFTKRILREAMKGRLPESIRARKCKVGFASPVTEWMGGALKPFVLDSLHSSSFVDSSIWDGPKIRDFVLDCYERQDLSGVRSCWEFIQAHILVELFRGHGSKVC